MHSRPIDRPHGAVWILFLEACAFFAIIVLSWANELLGISARIFGDGRAGNWHDAAITTMVTAAVAGPALYISWRIARRLHYLEEFYIVCAWCKQIGRDGQWVSMEQFMVESLHSHPSHGICDACADKFRTRKEGRTPIPGSPEA